MICKICKCRYASFPEQDFDLITKWHPLYGLGMEFVPKNKEAEQKRRVVFDSNEHGICEVCLNEY